MLVVLYDIQNPLYTKCAVIDRYIARSLIREVFHLETFLNMPQDLPVCVTEEAFFH